MSSGRRRQRLSGRRRRAPSPEQGASTSTRSNGAGRPRRSGPVRHDHLATRGAQRLGDQQGAVRLALVGQQPSTFAGWPARRAARPCHRVRRRGRASARRGPRRRARVRARATSCEPASCTPARPSRTAGIAPGSPDSRVTPSGDRVGEPAELLDGRQAWSGHQGHPRALVVGREQGLELVGPAEGTGQLDHDPRRVREPHGLRGVEQVHPRVQVALDDPAHQRVGEAGRLVADPLADQLDGAGDGGVVGHPHREHLVCTEPERVADGRVGWPPGEMVDDRVVRPLAAERPADQLGDEGGVAALDPSLAQQLRQHQVGVGVVLADGPQHVVRRQPGCVDAAHARNSLTSFLGAVATQASVITSASSSRVISPSLACWTRTAL